MDIVCIHTDQGATRGGSNVKYRQASAFVLRGTRTIKYACFRSGQEFREHRPIFSTLEINGYNFHLFCEFCEHLAASATRSDGLFGVGDNHDSAKGASASGDGREDSITLRTDRESIGNVLNVAPDEDFPFRGLQCRPYLKVGVRSVGHFSGFPCGFYQGSQCIRATHIFRILLFLAFSINHTTSTTQGSLRPPPDMTHVCSIECPCKNARHKAQCLPRIVRVLQRQTIRFRESGSECSWSNPWN